MRRGPSVHRRLPRPRKAIHRQRADGRIQRRDGVGRSRRRIPHRPQTPPGRRHPQAARKVSDQPRPGVRPQTGGVRAGPVARFRAPDRDARPRMGRRAGARLSVRFRYNFYHRQPPKRLGIIVLSAWRRFRSLEGMLHSFLLFAWRNLKKNRVSSAINILGLATGMGIALLIGLWMYDELTFDHYFDNHRQIAQAMSVQTVNGELRTSKAMLLPAGLEMEQRWGNDFKRVALTSWNQDQILAYRDTKLSSAGLFAQPAFAGIFGLKMLEGSRDGL